MKKTKFTAILAILTIFIFAICGCSKKEEPVGMPNPMVAVDSDEAFMDQLGISIDTEMLSPEVERFIINNEMAHIVYSASGNDGEDVKLVLRAAKNNEDISGVYDDNMTSFDNVFGNVTVTCRSSESNGIEIYDFYKDDIHFCYMVEGEISQMLFGELFDGVCSACGIVIE